MAYFFIAVGGVAGALARWGIQTLWETGGFPWDTLVINLLGCFLLTLFLRLTLERFVLDANHRLGVGTGFFGSFTTFSTYTAEVLGLLDQGRWLAGMAYGLGSLLMGLAAAWAGWMLAQFLLVGKGREEDVA